MIAPHFQIPFQAQAHPDALVYASHVRFTVLTAQLIRIEYSLNDHFEDRASQVFWHRRQPVPEFEVERDGNTLCITTEHLRLKYLDTPSGLTPDTLSIEVLATHATWRYGDWGEKHNLRGTLRTLDMIDGATRLERGFISRTGWAVVDDSESLLFDSDGWVEMRGETNSVDVYFFGYGHEYKKCLHDYVQLAGRVPLIPRWMLGNWWSRYWEYSQPELLALMADFKQYQVPLSVCIIDMDWHVTQTGNSSSGWTGYSWNRTLFPNPQECLDCLHELGLKVALNLHPAEGVHPHEEQYAQMAQALGLDPAAQNPIEFDLVDPKFTQAYLEILHHPHEAQGVDFWWLDWQQGTRSRLRGLDPLMWLNHLHFYDLGRTSSNRPVIFSRWGGLGSHRYPIGFSGDSIISWASLAFQPYLTATAANVAFGWWSHDIGGHHRGIEEAELYTRWVQLGVFSPILRLHSTKNPYHERRPWGYDAEVLRITRDALQLRHALIPYIYTMAWRNSVQALPLVTPLYYDYPEEDAAYHCRTEYTFGSELLAAPFVTPHDPDTCLSRQMVWLPPGDWFDFFTGEYWPGGRWHAVYGALDEIPVFAKAGAIVPLGPKVSWGGVGNPAELTVNIFPSADNRFELYEDDGETTSYQRGQSAFTPFTLTWKEQSLEFTIGSVKGAAALLPSPRTYQLHFRGVRHPDHVQLHVNGAEQAATTRYEQATETFSVKELVLRAGDALTLELAMHDGDLRSCRDRRLETCRKLLRAFRMNTHVKVQIDQDLPRILNDPSLLRGYGSEVKDAHLAALTNIVESR